MATAAQTLANRTNAQRSTGPATPEGKARSAANATRHGLSGTHFAILPNEDRAAFERLLEDLRDEFEPRTPSQHILVEQAAKARWKVLRAERLEAEAFEQMLTDPAAPNNSTDAVVLASLTATNGTLEKVQRYAAAAERAYSKAVRELQHIKRDEAVIKSRSADTLLHELLYCPRPAKPPVQNEPDFDAESDVLPATTRLDQRTPPHGRLNESASRPNHAGAGRLTTALG